MPQDLRNLDVFVETQRLIVVAAHPDDLETMCGGTIYHPEQLNERAGLGRLERVFVFSTDRDPDVMVDVTAVYPQKVAATIAHKTQFPEGEANLDWLKEIDSGIGEKIGVTYAEQFKQIAVW